MILDETFGIASVAIDFLVGAVYDLVKHKKVPSKTKGNKTEIPVEFTINDGKILLLTDRPLGALPLSVPAKAKKGSAYELKVSSPDRDVMISVMVSIYAPNGAKMSDSATATLNNGLLKRQITVPFNAAEGAWRIVVTNFADGSEKQATINIVKYVAF